MDNKEISNRAMIALKMFETSNVNQISNEDLLAKVNEALRLIKALADGR